MIDPRDLLERWAADEARFRLYGQDAAADVLARCRGDLETWWRERQLDTLTLEQAAEHSGLAAETIRKKIAAGEIPNAGRKGAPLAFRRDLPTKAAGRPRHSDAIDFADEIIARRLS